MFIDAALLEKAEKAIEQPLEVSIEISGCQDTNAMEILVLTEKLREDC